MYKYMLQKKKMMKKASNFYQKQKIVIQVKTFDLLNLNFF